FVPAPELWKMILTSRIYVALILGAVGWSIAIHSALPIMMVVTPRFYGGTHFFLCALSPHAGLDENVYDHRLNTRSVHFDPLCGFLDFDMNYHIEHNLSPLVPFYNLPKRHEEMKHELPRTYNGFIDVYREIVPLLIRQSGDPHFRIVRELPAASAAPV